ncbi:PP2C family protein-serine/threonine phosphatase [Paractinoplanes lichenicola]|uniref:SpoIIE family protein phosphatase n=1 Tax=Paractinoplanes lichenicola TaxID=2802976 RepID=A0ABS1VIA8_9ACTN|nr:GAF domain-containing SpoIIE family protein phosphatase [Actinoplanes lichenicola]MBL7253482.1 SpoIIE family protein phosphatase [Actinoplanes lichenicola]
MTPPSTPLLRPERLAAVRRSGLLDTAPEEPFDRLTRLACELLDAPFGFVTVVDERRSFWKSCIGVTGDDRQNPVGESFCQYVIAGDDAVIVTDAREDPLTSDNPSIEKMGVIAWAGYPVRSPEGHVLGSFCVVDNEPRAWTEQEKRTLEVLAHAASGEVALRISAEEAAREAERARAHAEKYRHLALTLQQSLLPAELPAIDGLDVAAGHRLGGDDVLGDFYDAVPTPTGWAIFLGDVTGQGAHAARTGALARHTLRAGALRVSSPAIVLTELDAALHRWYDESGTPGFATVAYVALRPAATGFSVRICTAGHPAGLLRRADGTVHPAGRASSPIGILPKLSLKVDDFELSPGDTLVLHTNSVTAGRGSNFAEDDLAGLLSVLEAPTAHEVVDAVLARATANVEFSDDMAVIAIRVPG